MSSPWFRDNVPNHVTLLDAECACNGYDHYARRAHDIGGRLPTPDEVQDLIDTYHLRRPEFHGCLKPHPIIPTTLGWYNPQIKRIDWCQCCFGSRDCCKVPGYCVAFPCFCRGHSTVFLCPYLAVYMTKDALVIMDDAKVPLVMMDDAKVRLAAKLAADRPGKSPGFQEMKISIGAALDEFKGQTTDATPVKFVKLEKELVSVPVDTVAQLVHPQILPQELLLYQLINGDSDRISCPSCLGVSLELKDGEKRKPSLVSLSSQLSMSIVTSTWLYYDNSTGWLPYDADTNETLEECYQETKNAIIQFQGPHVEVLIDLSQMQQMNIHTGEVAAIRRFGCDKMVPGLHVGSSMRSLHEDNAYDDNGDSTDDQPRKRLLSIVRGESFRVPSNTDTNENSTWVYTDSGKQQWEICEDLKWAALLEDGYVRYHRADETAQANLRHLSCQGWQVDFQAMKATKPLGKSVRTIDLRRLGADITKLYTVGQRNQLRRKLLASLTPTDGIDVSLTSFWSSKDNIQICSVCLGEGEVSKHLTAEQAKLALSPDTANAGVNNDAEDATACQVCWGDGAYGVSATCNHLFCVDCVRGTLEACLDLGKLPAYCPTCQMEQMDDLEHLPENGQITEPVLRFLQQRGVISRPFYYRFTKAMDRETNNVAGTGNGDGDDEKKGKQRKPKTSNSKANFTEVDRDWRLCPGKCNTYLLNKHESYGKQGMGLFYEDGKNVYVRLGECPVCHILICPRCERTEGRIQEGKSHNFRHNCPKVAPKDDPATLKLLNSLGKKCPACGNVVQKNAGCDLMMCGTNAHGKVTDALRNGGCAYIFSWNSLQAVRDGHGYTNAAGVWVKGQFGPSNDRQVLLKK